MAGVSWSSGCAIRVSPSLFRETGHFGTDTTRYGHVFLSQECAKFNGGSNGVGVMVVRMCHPCLPIPFFVKMALFRHIRNANSAPPHQGCVFSIGIEILRIFFNH